MGQMKSPFFLMAILALAVPLAGCGRDRVERLDVEPANPFKGAIRPMEGGVAKAPIGTETDAGPYKVRLTTPESPAVGANRFVARVQENGQPAQNVMVSMALTRASLNEPGSTVSMTRTAPGTYAGTSAISEAGGWLAKVTVVGKQGTSNAYYTLSTDGGTNALQASESATSVQRGSKPVEPLPNAPGTWGNGQFGGD